jgi:PAS domain S-box-containing protein
MEFVGAIIDITAAKKTEDRMRQSQEELRRIVDTIPAFITTALPDGYADFISKSYLAYTGVCPEEWLGWGWTHLTHPEDVERAVKKWRAHLATGEPFEEPLRLRKANGEYRWFLGRSVPLRDEKGKIVKWYCVLHDIEDQKRTEDRLVKALDEVRTLKDQLYKENIALREEVDKVSMFEEIVGASAALKAVLTRIGKVGPTDSAVLITGETGTGKELVARAVHRMSQRSSRAFVTVNCAAIPPALIASELFGHEKGAFTGAHERHLGRFELAEGGTIFLDEIGELSS